MTSLHIIEELLNIENGDKVLRKGKIYECHTLPSIKTTYRPY